MRTFFFSIAVAATCFLVPFKASATVILYDGEFTQDVTTNDGGRSDNYDPDTAYALHGYNGGVTYTEQADTTLGDGTGTELQIVTDGGVDGFLRYNPSQAAVDNWLNNTGSGEDGFLNDLEAFNILRFDVVWLGDSDFGTVIIGPNSNASGVGADYYSQGLVANTPTTISYNLFGDSVFQGDLSEFAGDSSATFFQIRIEAQTGSSDGGGTFVVDNFRLVPEPSSLSLLLITGLGLVATRKRAHS